MVFSKTITTAANTAESSPLITDLIITKGLVYLIEAYFPPGSSGLLHLQVFDGNYQLFPYTIGESYYGDNIRFSYDDLYIKNTEPFLFTAKTWNDDDTYQHKLMLNIALVSHEVYQARFLPTIQIDYMKKIFEQILQQQEKAAAEQAGWGFSALGKPEE